MQRGYMHCLAPVKGKLEDDSLTSLCIVDFVHSSKESINGLVHFFVLPCCYHNVLKYMCSPVECVLPSCHRFIISPPNTTNLDLANTNSKDFTEISTTMTVIVKSSCSPGPVCSMYHVFTCGHSESEPLAGFESHQYFFADGPCTRSQCASTNSSWFHKMYSLPDPELLEYVERLSWKLKHIQNLAKADQSSLNNTELGSSVNPAAIGHPQLPDVLGTEDLQSAIDKYLSIGETKAMLSNLRRFAKKPSQRPWFDFCLAEVRQYLDIAGERQQTLHNAIDDLRMPRSAHKSRSHQCCGADIGAEIDLLRYAGKHGSDLLRRPLTPRTLHFCGILIGNMEQELDVQPVKVTQEPVAAFPPTDPFEAWLQQEEIAFKAEMAKKERKTRGGKLALKRLSKRPTKIVIPSH